jgi:hypothetical protein
MPIRPATPCGKADAIAGRALWLAGAAMLALVVLPLLHAEEHIREELADEAEAAALADSWKAGSTDPLDRLEFALERAHRPQRPERRREHGHRHSHGPSRRGPHGAGALPHLSIALHAAPQLPDLTIGAPKHAAPVAVEAQLGSPLRYLVPEWSQGPPARC